LAEDAVSFVRGVHRPRDIVKFPALPLLGHTHIVIDIDSALHFSRDGKSAIQRQNALAAIMGGSAE
jgi:hypothetical protein